MSATLAAAGRHRGALGPQPLEEQPDPVGARLGCGSSSSPSCCSSAACSCSTASTAASGRGFPLRGRTLDSSVGLLNTLILLTSSLSMALGVGPWRAAAGPAVWLLGATILGGLAFLPTSTSSVHKIEHGLYPGSAELARHTPARTSSTALLRHDRPAWRARADRPRRPDGRALPGRAPARRTFRVEG